MICFKNFEDCPFPLLDEKPNTAFVLMPFAKQFDKVYLKGIKDGLPTGWECNRSDERWDIPEAVCKICKSIQEATLIIGDITGRNPNVFLELGLSFGSEKKFILITQNINDLPFDVRTFNAIEYNPSNLDDLHGNLREAIKQLKPIPRISEEAFAFDKNLENAEEILEYQVSHTEQSEPVMQIFIGSKNIERDWLPQNSENISLLECAPRFFFRVIRGRHNYYEFQPRDKKHFLRIMKNGFIISKFPSAQWDSEKGTIYIHEWVGYIAGIFLFACRVMKKKGIKDSQRIKIEILNVKGHPVRVDIDSSRSRWVYDFVEYSIILEEDFNPDNNWKSLLDILVRIYRVICEHAGITDIIDKTIKTELRVILSRIDELHTTYTNSGVTALNMNEFFENKS